MSNIHDTLDKIDSDIREVLSRTNNRRVYCEMVNASIRRDRYTNHKTIQPTLNTTSIKRNFLLWFMFVYMMVSIIKVIL